MLKPLLDKITPYLSNQESSTVTNLMIVVMAMLDKRTVCINKLKSAVGGIIDKPSTKVQSHYTRLIRFFRDHSSGDLWIHIVRCGLQLLRLDSRYLALDGSSWQAGGVWQHYITLCIVYRGVAIPIFWTDLAKQGSSSIAERITLFDRALKYFVLRGKVLLADREYIGIEWFNYLIDKQIDFVIRSRDYSYFALIDEFSSGRTVEEMIAKAMRSRKANKAVSKAFRLSEDGPTLWIVVAKNPHPEGKEDFMILITSLDQNAYTTVADYLKRWKIEHCFRQLKSNGFDLEKMNLGSVKRRRLLMAVVVLAYIVAVVEGLKDYKDVVPFKTHGSQGRVYRAISLFRHGIDRILQSAVRLPQFVAYFVGEIRQATRGYRSSQLLNV
jgi:hypothetical protein